MDDHRRTYNASSHDPHHHRDEQHDSHYSARDAQYRDQPHHRPSNAEPEQLAHATQPLKNALHHAFDNSDSARTVDPDLIRQITEEVKKSVLDEIKQSTSGSQAPLHNHLPQSPVSATSIPSREVYTPPSPYHGDRASHSSPSPESPLRGSLFEGVDDTPTPRQERTAPIDIPQHQPSARPAPAPRLATEETFSPIEKMWQRLFDHDGNATPRLGQFLRGLAVHLIEDYEPKKSLVITPAKMLQFYEETRIGEETYPWQTIFAKLSYPALCKVYREMRCQHHLVQEHSADQPFIPALTPIGFQEWMTAMIQAYPSSEYERLSKAVLDMPISNADDSKERFPKELSRRLFPQQENLQAQQRCAAALSSEGCGPLRRAPTFPPPPPLSQSAGSAATFERERSPYGGQPEFRSMDTRSMDTRSMDSEDDHDEPLAVPIERERKPYSAAPGGGKLYEDDLSRSMPPSDMPAHTSRRRAPSNAAQAAFMPQSNLPPASHQQHHAHSISHAANTRRARSPSFSGYGTRSDPNNLQDIPSSYYASNVVDSEDERRRAGKDTSSASVDPRRHERSARHPDGGHHRRGTTGTDSSFDSQPRSVYADDDQYRGRNGSSGYETRGGYEPRRY